MGFLGLLSIECDHFFLLFSVFRTYSSSFGNHYQFILLGGYIFN